MIAADTSSLIAFNAGDTGKDIDRLLEALQAGMLALPPTVVSEILSDPHLPARIEDQVLKIPVLEITSGYAERVGRLRRFFLKKGMKCRLADAQIAQSCIDANVPLISRDQDFKKFQDNKLEIKMILGP